MINRCTRRRLGAVGIAAALGLTVAVPAGATTDPSQGGLWYYTVPGIDQIQAAGTTGDGITIAVIDGPVNPTVPDLADAGLQVHEPSFCDLDEDGTSEPATATTLDAEHATELASLIAGTARGSGGQAGVQGVAPGATLRLYAKDAMDAPCDGLAPAIEAAVSDSADIISLSFASSGLAPAEIDALAAAERAGVVVIAASNNRGGTDLGWPALANGVISVESADVDQQLSDRAVTNPLLTVVAPGEGLRVPAVDASGTWGYALVGGSSYATAWTAGVLALAWSAHPDATGNQMIQALLRTTAQSTGGEPARIDDSWGYGTVSARNLVALDPTTLPDTNPLLRDTPDAIPAYNDIVTAAPTQPPATDKPTPKATEPTNATDTTDDADSTSTVPLIIGGVLILLAITGAIVAATIFTRRKQHTEGA